MDTSTERYKALYKKLYRMFDSVTPLKADCGRVCSASCCKGDEQTGMRLFPHEETTLRLIENQNGRFAVCDGKCIRSERPLSCRIFPLFPLLTPEGKISVAPDARGYAVCPLVRQYENVLFSKRFVKRVRRAGERMAKDGELRAFLREISAEIGEAEEIQHIME